MPILSRFRLLLPLLLLAVLPVHAQLPSLLPLKQAQPAATADKANAVHALTPEKELAEAQNRQRDAQDAMARIQRQLGQMGLTPAARNDLLKRFNFVQTLSDRYAQQIDYLGQLQILDQKIADAKRQQDSWVPPAGEAPWSIVDGDQISSEMALKSARIAQLTREIDSSSNQILLLSREKADTEVKLRQAQEKVGNADSTTVPEADRQRVEDARDMLALKAAILLRTDLERRVKERERGLQELQLETGTRTWNYYAGRFMLTPEVLAQAKGKLQELIDRDRELELKALAKSELAVKRLALAQNNFRLLDQGKAAPDQLAKARAALEIAQTDEVATRSEVDRLRQMVEMGGYGLQVWDARAEIYAKPRPDAARIDEIASRVKLGILRVRQARDFLQQNLKTRDQEAFDLREAAIITKNDLERRVIAAKLSSVNAQSDASRSVLAALDKFEQYLLSLQSELGLKEKDKTYYERLMGLGQRIAAMARSVWAFELFTVDDSVIADGKEVKTSRSVTVGKSIGAIGILLFGFVMISWLIRNALGLAEKRMGLKSSSATLVRRWLMIISTGTLIVLSFNLVQIPLSVFAFLGGALAIGVGFGTQNLLKNLISGVMLLIERPIRIGDLVQIDAVKGRVTSIGIRFSTIHSGDGVDTLIPNSELVEKKLVNWTYSNPEARREISIGVAYGANVVQVKNLLQAAALEHPDVEQNPQPTVTLDDLADSALVFTLRFWVRLDQGTDGKQIDSDLRCEILEKLAATGIQVPFPQRDVRLQLDGPLPVSLSTVDSGTPAP